MRLGHTCLLLVEKGQAKGLFLSKFTGQVGKTSVNRDTVVRTAATAAAQLSGPAALPVAVSAVGTHRG